MNARRSKGEKEEAHLFVLASDWLGTGVPEVHTPSGAVLLQYVIRNASWDITLIPMRVFSVACVL